MTEIELKFQVPAESRAAVAAAVAGRAGAGQVQRLQAAYHDTAERALANAGVALRLRREGPRWVQTLKASGGDAMTRLEHNVERPGRAAAAPPLDLALHAGTPAGARLAEVLSGAADPVLACQFRTDIRRLSRRVRTHGAVMELAFDTGRVQADAQVQPLCELEIELLRGTPGALLACARQWVSRHGLWLDTRSKAERGDLLARGLPYTPARKAVAVRLTAGMPAVAAQRAVLQACAQQVLPNASQVASGTFGDEHVHQLRVGLRRLRAAIALFDGATDSDSEATPLAAASAALFRELGAARDQAAIGAPLRAQLEQAISAAGLALVAPSLPQATGADPARALRSAAAQALLLDLLDSTLPTLAAQDAAEDSSLTALLAVRLERWHRQVKRDVRAFADLDDAARHRLRKRVKRLRYALEFTQALFGRKKVARYLRVLSDLQDRLGALNDVGVAITAFRRAPSADAALAFALGWLVARREALATACAPALDGFARARRPWKCP
ncbi:MAG: CYTH and CHAD domain-containing protein [Piscinibacter sp.]|nr:CYTH and CHAD domain-containing protein [Piscinibacter sp.]